MSGLFGGASSTPSTSTLGDLKQDVALSDPPTDSISALAFSPAANTPDFLAVASWDNKIRVYEIAQNGQSQGRHVYEHSQPVLDCDFSKVSRDGLGLVLGSREADSTTTAGRHQDRIRRRRQACQGVRPQLPAGHCHRYARPARADLSLL